MTKQEFSLIAMAIKTYYPKENILPNDKALELWFEQLCDIPYQVAEAGLKKWVSLNKWSPSIADLREMATSITNGELDDWSTAWSKVLDAVRTFGFYNSDKALETLEPLTREAVKRLGFTNICMSENPQTDRANFRMIYESLAERKKKDAQIPVQVKNLIAQMPNLMIEEGDT